MEDFNPLLNNLANRFFETMTEAYWPTFSSETESTLLIVAILLDYFLKNNVKVEKSTEVFRYMLDHALNSYSLRITDFDVQRILLKREVRFLFLLLSLLGQVSKSLEHSFFEEIYLCS